METNSVSEQLTNATALNTDGPTEISLKLTRYPEDGGVVVGLAGTRSVAVPRAERRKVATYLEEHVDKHQFGSGGRRASSKVVGNVTVDPDGQVLEISVDEEYVKESQR